MNHTSQQTIMERRRKTATLDLTLETPGLAAEAGLLSPSLLPRLILPLLSVTQSTVLPIGKIMCFLKSVGKNGFVFSNVWTLNGSHSYETRMQGDARRPHESN